jgi:hypothetical protein
MSTHILVLISAPLLFSPLRHWHIAIILSAGLIEMLESRRGNQGLYMGCMKSGVVVSEEYVLSVS